MREAQLNALIGRYLTGKLVMCFSLNLALYQMPVHLLSPTSAFSLRLPPRLRGNSKATILPIKVHTYLELFRYVCLV